MLRVNGMTAMLLAALALSACSWTMPIRVTERENPERVVGCRSTAPLFDTTATVLEGIAAGALIAAAGSHGGEECEEFGCMGAGYGEGVVALVFIGVGVIQAASMVTGWVRYSHCQDELAPGPIPTSPSPSQPSPAEIPAD